MLKRKIRITLRKRAPSRAVVVVLLLIVAAASLIAALGAASPSRIRHASFESPSANSAREVTLTLRFKDGAAERSFRGEAADAMTISDALFISSVKGSFDVRLDDMGNLVELNGSSGQWVVLRNDRPVEAPLTQTLLSPGDTVRIEPARSS